jgi:hypothetical protein
MMMLRALAISSSEADSLLDEARDSLHNIPLLSKEIILGFMERNKLERKTCLKETSDQLTEFKSMRDDDNIELTRKTDVSLSANGNSERRGNNHESNTVAEDSDEVNELDLLTEMEDSNTFSFNNVAGVGAKEPTPLDIIHNKKPETIEGPWQKLLPICVTIDENLG